MIILAIAEQNHDTPIDFHKQWVIGSEFTIFSE